MEYGTEAVAGLNEHHRFLRFRFPDRTTLTKFVSKRQSIQLEYGSRFTMPKRPLTSKGDEGDTAQADDADNNKKVASPLVAKRPDTVDNDDEESSSSSSDEDEDLVLEGVIVRNPDVSDSDDTSSEEEDDDDDDNEDTKPPFHKRFKPTEKTSSQAGTVDMTKATNAKGPPKVAKAAAKTDRKKKTKKPKEAGPEIVQVEFTFCDMDEKFFHGLKTLLTAASPIFGPYTSALSDLMIENVSVGTVTSTEGDEEGTVYGFCSVLNVTTYQDHDCIQGLKRTLLDKCPVTHKAELETVLSGQTKRPAGFYLHGRMVNMPLEIVQVLHEQVVLDMDWAVDHAEGGEDERKSLDFGAFVVLAPTYKVSGVSYFRLFDDEIFATHAEFTYEITLPKGYGMEETPYCTVIVLTKTGHRAAMKSLAELVGSGGSALPTSSGS